MKVSSAFAAWLIVLILLPFTAPFSTYEVLDHLSYSSHGSPFVPHTDAQVGVDTATALVPARIGLRVGKPAGIARPRYDSTRRLTCARVAHSTDSVASALDLQALHTV